MQIFVFYVHKARKLSSISLLSALWPKFFGSKLLGRLLFPIFPFKALPIGWVLFSIPPRGWTYLLNTKWISPDLLHCSWILFGSLVTKLSIMEAISTYWLFCILWELVTWSLLRHGKIILTTLIRFGSPLLEMVGRLILMWQSGSPLPLQLPFVRIQMVISSLSLQRGFLLAALLWARRGQL